MRKTFKMYSNCIVSMGTIQLRAMRVVQCDGVCDVMWYGSDVVWYGMV